MVSNDDGWRADTVSSWHTADAATGTLRGRARRSAAYSGVSGAGDRTAAGTLVPTRSVPSTAALPLTLASGPSAATASAVPRCLSQCRESSLQPSARRAACSRVLLPSASAASPNASRRRGMATDAVRRRLRAVASADFLSRAPLTAARGTRRAIVCSRQGPCAGTRCLRPHPQASSRVTQRSYLSQNDKAGGSNTRVHQHTHPPATRGE